MCLPSFIGCLVGSVSVTCCVGCLVVRPLGPGVGHLVSALFCRLRVCYVLSAIFLGQLSSFGSWPSRRRWCRPSCRLAPRLAPRMRCSQRSCRPSSRACCCFGRLSSGQFSRASSPATCGPSCRRRCPIFRRPSQRAWVSLLNASSLSIIPTKVLVSHPGSLVSPDKGSLDVQSRGYHHSGRGWNSCQELRMGGLLPFSILDLNSETLWGDKPNSLIPK